MAKFDTIALEPWAKFRAGKVKNNTIKRDFTFITSFTQFCALTRNNYCKALTNNMVEEKPDSWLPFDKNELELIFSNLPISDKDENWEFWIPLIGLYTGGRISEISALRIDNFKTIINIEVYHLPGTKTDASPRDLPIHPDLIDIGLLSLVEKKE